MRTQAQVDVFQMFEVKLVLVARGIADQVRESDADSSACSTYFASTTYF